MKKPLIYIIGKVGDLSDDEYYNSVCIKFANRKRELEALGYKVINPMELVERGSSWEYAMRICIPAMLQCKFISTLPDYTESRGGMIEYDMACKFTYKNIQPSKVNEHVSWR